ncbi:hypothetical protein [Rhodococcus pyridinivorans]|nr:hypothetical protein [Rhodococcus pyridinivorans]
MTESVTGSCSSPKPDYRWAKDQTGLRPADEVYNNGDGNGAAATG